MENNKYNCGNTNLGNLKIDITTNCLCPWSESYVPDNLLTPASIFASKPILIPIKNSEGSKLKIEWDPISKLFVSNININNDEKIN